MEGLPLRGRPSWGPRRQLGIFEAPPAEEIAPRDVEQERGSELERCLAEIEIERMTPLEALNALAELVARAR